MVVNNPLIMPYFLGGVAFAVGWPFKSRWFWWRLYDYIIGLPRPYKTIIGASQHKCISLYNFPEPSKNQDFSNPNKGYLGSMRIYRESGTGSAAIIQLCTPPKIPNPRDTPTRNNKNNNNPKRQNQDNTWLKTGGPRSKRPHLTKTVGQETCQRSLLIWPFEQQMDWSSLESPPSHRYHYS